MYNVLGLSKTNSPLPEQEYELVFRDSENQKPGYVRSSVYGTEAGIRAALKTGGLAEAQIEALLEQASMDRLAS